MVDFLLWFIGTLIWPVGAGVAFALFFINLLDGNFQIKK